MYRERWEDLHNEIHCAAFCLDPEYHYVDHSANADAIEGLISFAEKVLGEETPELHKAMEQFSSYKNKEGLFAHSVVWKNAKTMRGGEWWRLYGGQAPQLAKVAIRALSAPTAAGAGERNWSTYGFIVSRLRNKLSALRAKKLVFVHYNKRVARKVKRVDYVSEAFEWDPIEGSDVPVSEGSDSEEEC